jgi:hypothetical protein
MTLPSAEYLRNRLRYEPETGFLFWRRYEPMGLAWNSRNAGKRTGALHGHNSKPWTLRRRLMIDKSYYTETHVIWAMMTGVWPTLTIDHINRIGTDNRFENLRLATMEQQRGNQAHKPNASGFLGVTFVGRRYRARIRLNGKEEVLGLFESAEEAHAAYRRAAIEKWGEFYLDPSHLDNATLQSRST